ncbi:phosphotriesterase family protein [Streptomyces rapamycinicus]|uniref:Phosphotriesterase n=2 Tax=Streptomyces rapamycinicus TaxID=1226757 RepID=A0A0A0NKX7_STRRN|nr:phosphotriesterase-related protein [Streptomyces rapamycinicus]AGP60227.1 phosphotriesterase [Streptomyces rapamycinicus NRRL 5491]MBB4788610.1 phosphotriesterase-related protein [Streptomyces rapamycinicus]RLV72941.1 phosphotriesterase [Streptomyces rapamycinicus NRRL 5491]UTP35810.1 phosphotriesterase-related protein [Streptomyces rapamycinicus NRRL 5491]
MTQNTDEPVVATAGGPVPVSRLGTTLMHEHIFVTSPEIQQNWPDYPEQWDEETQIEAALKKLADAKANGIDTIVDLTVIGLGRYVPRVKRVAEQTDVNIVVATGAYVLHDLPVYFHYRGPGTPAGGPDRMYEFFVRDIEEGVTGTGVRAAILKCVTDAAGLTPDVERVLRSVARAHRRTGAPITTHTHAGLRRGLDQQQVFANEGVDLSRVIIGHSGDTDDYGYLEELIAAGSYLGMDRFGLDTVPFGKRVEIVAEMCRRGHADKMVLSHDTSCFSDMSDPVRRRELYPDWRWTHIPQDVVPALLERGVTQEQIDQMMVENPRRIFSHDGGY